jgi:hypothetical protein
LAELAVVAELADVAESADLAGGPPGGGEYVTWARPVTLGAVVVA